MAGTQQDLPIDEVELDRDNPRIRRFLEGYEGELTDERIALALDVAGEAAEEGKGAMTPEKLRNSGVRHRTGRIARFVARIGNMVRQPWLRAILLPYRAVA